MGLAKLYLSNKSNKSVLSELWFLQRDFHALIYKNSWIKHVSNFVDFYISKQSKPELHDSKIEIHNLKMKKHNSKIEIYNSKIGVV